MRHLLPFDASDCQAQAQVLGGFALGVAPDVAVPWPCQRVRVPLLDGSGDSCLEAWQVDGAVSSGQADGLVWRRSGDMLFGVIEVDEAAMAVPDGHSRLERASAQIYRQMFTLLDQQGLPHLWRIWNYLPDIHGQEMGLERYRQFNVGRAEGFASAARSVVGRVPAACALGVRQGPLTVAFLAGASPAVPLENPRQLSAFRYPQRYGPQSPTFARAALAYPDGQEWLLVSGTASIVGHETRHAGDVRAQCHETMENLQAVVDQANGCRRSVRPFDLDGMGLRVYLRHARDLDVVREVVRERCPGAALGCVQADVCREDLLVEIEAWGVLPC
ncbi:MAG: hypothetical protein R3E94_07985 [Burkholderiaceae bacterium]